MSESMLSKKSSEVAERLGGAAGLHAAAFDIGSILSILTTIIALFQQCGLSSSQAHARAVNPRFLDRRRLRHLTEQVKRRGGSREAAEFLEAAIMDAGADLTLEEMKALYAEVPH